MNLLSNLNYGSPVGISEHVTLSAQLQLCCNLQGKKTVHTKFYTDYAVLNHDISNIDWETLLSSASVNDNWIIFKEHLVQLVDKNTVKQTVTRSTKKPWISKKLLQMVCKKRALWKRFKNSRSDTDYAAHRAYSNRLSVEIKAAKRTYELRVANSKDPKILYKYIRNRLTGPVRNPQLRNENGVIVTDDEIIANLFAETFAQSYTRETVTNTTPLLSTPKVNFALSDIAFPEELIKIKLSKLKSTTSPGPDGITPTVLNKCAETVCIPLKILMTQSFQNSQLPEDWRLAIVKPIFKKGDKFQAVNYRPISLTAVIAKIMESIISDGIRKFLLANNVLPAEQHGFVPKKSVSTNLLCAVSDWTKNFDRGVATDVVYFDFCKAFDKVPTTNLLLKLRHYGITGLLLEWIKGFLTNRSFRVKFGASLSDLTAVESGVPQGSVLGPLLFITYIADLKTEIQSRCLFYADAHWRSKSFGVSTTKNDSSSLW